MNHDELVNESTKILLAILGEFAGVTGAAHQHMTDEDTPEEEKQANLKSREDALTKMKGEIDRAADEGKPVVNTKEGGFGDPELSKRAKEHATRLGVKYSEEDLDTPEEEKDWGDPRHVQAMKASDPESGIKHPKGIGPFDAFPEDDPSGKTPQGPVSRGVKGINRARRRQWVGRWKQVQQRGGINISTVGGGHNAVLQRYFRMAQRKRPAAQVKSSEYARRKKELA